LVAYTSERMKERVSFEFQQELAMNK